VPVGMLFTFLLQQAHMSARIRANSDAGPTYGSICSSSADVMVRPIVRVPLFAGHRVVTLFVTICVTSTEVYFATVQAQRPTRVSENYYNWSNQYWRNHEYENKPQSYYR